VNVDVHIAAIDLVSCGCCR